LPVLLRAFGGEIVDGSPGARRRPARMVVGHPRVPGARGHRGRLRAGQRGLGRDRAASRCNSGACAATRAGRRCGFAGSRPRTSCRARRGPIRWPRRLWSQLPVAAIRNRTPAALSPPLQLKPPGAGARPAPPRSAAALPTLRQQPHGRRASAPPALPAAGYSAAPLRVIVKVSSLITRLFPCMPSPLPRRFRFPSSSAAGLSLRSRVRAQQLLSQLSQQYLLVPLLRCCHRRFAISIFTCISIS
jgi:hypothetical protein